MKKFVVCLLVTYLAAPLSAQEFSIGPTIDELNNLAVAITDDEMTKADFIEVLDAGCIIFGHAVETRVSPNFAALVRLIDWDPESVGAFARTEQFVEIETAIFAVSGANARTLFLLRNDISESEGKISLGFVSAETEGQGEVTVLRDRTCETYAASVEAFSASSIEITEVAATEEEQSTARSVAKGAVGIGAMVLDALWVKGSAGLGAAIGGIASGGWGWNRVEESYFELRGR